ADLDDNESDSEDDYGFSANCGHHISHQVKNDPGGQHSDFQCKLEVPIIPQIKTDFPSVVVDREIARMRNEVDNPVRKHSKANEHECLFLISRDPSHRYLCHVERSRDISRYHNSMACTALKVRDSSTPLGMTLTRRACQSRPSTTLCGHA